MVQGRREPECTSVTAAAAVCCTFGIDFSLQLFYTTPLVTGIDPNRAIFYDHLFGFIETKAEEGAGDQR